MDAAVLLQGYFLHKRQSAIGTGERSLSRVKTTVRLQVAFDGECFVADRTLVGFLAAVDATMSVKIAALGK